MINSVLTPTMTYAMCSMKLPVGVIENIDRARKQCLWRGNDATKKGQNLAAWAMVQKPKDKGGLGVLNLRLQNYALLLKQLHKFHNKHSTPWVQLIWKKYYAHKVPHAAGALGSFWWRDLLKLCTLYRGIATCTVGDGSFVSFWDDLWSGEILSTKYPWLFSFALNPDVSVNQVMLSDDLDTIFNLPISEPAFTELLDLQQHIQSVAFDHNSKEQWIFFMGKSGLFIQALL